MSKFCLAKVRISDSLFKVCMFLIIHMVYYWTSSELDMAEVHISKCELLPECKGVQLHAFNGKGAYLAVSVCLSIRRKFVDN